jgi:hypothetical protein
MKKIIITLIVLKSISLNAQQAIVGFKVGPSLFSQKTYIGSNFYESTEYGNEVGIIMGINGKHLGFQIEPSSLIVKINFQENIDNKKFETRISAECVNIPMIFRFKAGNEFRIFADLGVNYTSLAQIEKEVIGIPATSYSTKNFYFSKDHNHNFGVLFGMGVERDINNILMFSLGIRKQGSVFNYSDSNFNISSNTFIAYFGVCFRFSKQKNK